MKMQHNNLNLLTSRIIEAAISVHTELGPGLLESVYSAAMVVELSLIGIDAKSEVSVPVFYPGNKIAAEGFRMDLLVEDTVIVELKSVDTISNPCTKSSFSPTSSLVANHWGY